MTSQVGRFYLRTSEPSQRRLNRSDELTYQWLRHDDVSAWCGLLKLVTKMGQFLLVLCSKLPRHLRCFSLFKVPASTLLQRLKDVDLIWVPVMTSLGRVKLVSLT